MDLEDQRRRIDELRDQRNAIILAHNYQPPEIQDIADLTGDSLELSRKASETKASVIVFCGVRFMAETAAILNPDKIVLLPRLEAGCAMADTITADDVRHIKEKHPEMPIVTYVNSTAAVKAESTVCCTSANCIKIVEAFSNRKGVYMVPDRNLARYAASRTGKRVLYWQGFCPVHDNLTVDMVLAQKRRYPDALFIAHPECRPEVLELADVVASTSGMLRFVKESEHNEFIIGTEVGILHPMRKQNPFKLFYPASDGMICEDMKRIRLEDIIRTLTLLEPRVTVAEHIRVRALNAVERMLEIV